MFGGVINPKLVQLKSCINDFIYCFFCYNFKNLYENIIKCYNDYLNSFKSTKAFKFFLSNVDIVKLLQPYVKILIDATDHDIDVLTDLLSHLKIFNKFLNNFYDNVKNYYNTEMAYISSHPFCSYRDFKYLSSIISSIKKEIKLFYNYFTVLQHYYQIKYTITTFTLMKSELESFKQWLQSIHSTELSYIIKIKGILENKSKNKKSDSLTNIEEIEVAKLVPKNLYTLRQDIKNIRTRIDNFNKDLYTENRNLSFSYNYFINIISSPFNALFTSIKSRSFELEKYYSLFGSYTTPKNYINEIKTSIDKYRNMLEFLILEIDSIIDYIPSLVPKLRGAKSKLDKRKYIEHLLDLLEFKNTKSLKPIHELIDKIEDKSKIRVYINEAVSNGFILTQIYSIQWLINDSKVIDLIKESIKKSYSIINRILSIDKYIKTLQNINSKLLSTDENVDLNQLRLMINEIDKVLKEIDFKMAEEIQETISKLNEIKSFIIKYRNQHLIEIEKIVDNIISVLNLIKCFIEKLKSYRSELENKLECCENKIKELECAIEGVARNLVRCSLQSTNNSKVTVINQNWVNSVDNQVYGLYSVMNIGDYEAVVNRLFESAKKIDQILELNNCPDVCKCILGLEKTTKIELQINVNKIIEQITKGNYNDLKLNEIKALVENDIEDNHLCLCMVIKYILYPSIIKLIHIMKVDLDTLSTLSRKFSKYGLSKGFKVDLCQFLIMMINLVDSITKWISYNYPYAWTGWSRGVVIKCFCMYSNDPSYYSVVSTMLVISWLVENVWTMNSQSIMVSIECLSKMMNEFERIDSQNNESTDLNIFKLSFVSVLSSSTQSCKLLARLRIVVDLISLSKKVNVLEPFIGRYISNISLCNIFRFENVIKELKDYDKNSSGISFSDWVLKKYQSVSWPCRGCNNSNCCCDICVNSMILLASIYIWLKVNIKIYESNEDYKERLTNLLKCICNCGNDCCCKDLQSFCENICGKTCDQGCVCQQLKTAIDKICNGANSGDCLCKLIDETIGKCFKQGNCQCKKKGGCCRCPCCKLVSHSVMLLVRACRANVLEPYKRIVLDLIGSSKDKHQLIRSIVKVINHTILNNAYLCKNNLITNPNTYSNYMGVKDASTTNWGYDTR